MQRRDSQPARLIWIVRHAVLFLLLCVYSLSAQSLRAGKINRPAVMAGADLVERLNAMPPEQRRRLLDRMPPERRALLEKRIEQLNAIKPEDRVKLKKAYEDFQNLPEEKQDLARRIFKDINALEPPRRQQVRAAITRLRALDPADWNRRLKSRAVSERFSETEQQLIRQALEVLPAPAKDSPSGLTQN